MISFPLQRDVTIKRTTFWRRKMCRGWFLASGVPDLEKSHCELVAPNIDLRRPPLFLLAKLPLQDQSISKFWITTYHWKKFNTMRFLRSWNTYYRSETIFVLARFEIVTILNFHLQSFLSFNFFFSIFFSTSKLISKLFFLDFATDNRNWWGNFLNYH